MRTQTFQSHLSDGGEDLHGLWPLLGVPALMTLISFDAVASVLEFRGRHLGVSFPFPVPIHDLWSFVDPPSGGPTPGTVAGSLSIGDIGIAGLGALVYLLIFAVLTAGYLGSIHQYRNAQCFDFVANIERYAVSYLGVTAIVFGTMLFAAWIAVVSRLFLIPAVVTMLLVGYLLWGAWFIVPVSGFGAVQAVLESVDLAVSSRRYATWTLVHLGVGAAASIGLTLVTVNLGGLGILIGMTLALPIWFLLTYVSLGVIDEIDAARGVAALGTAG